MECNEDDECSITEQERETTEQIKRTLIASQQKWRSYEKKIDSLILFIKQMQDRLSLFQDNVAEFLKVRMH